MGNIRTSKRSLKITKANLSSLMACALALPGLGLEAVQAQSVTRAPIIRLEYNYYKERQENGGDRISVKAPQFWFKAPLNSRTEMEGSLVVDSVSGASPQYLNSISGASGIGIEDQRRAADFKLTRYFDRYSIGAGVVISDEDDYLSRGGVIDARLWSADKNTVVSFSTGFHNDDITSTNNRSLHESRKTEDFLIGVTQVIDQVSLVQFNLTWATSDGYHSDPYKFFDSRPQSRDQFAFLTRYNRYFKELGSSLHADYRYYWDSWSLESSMFELAWYQPLGKVWTIKPNVRYYTQTPAEFFSTVYPPQDYNSIYSTDFRLSGFGSVSTGIKLIRDLGDGLSTDLKFEYIYQSPGLKFGSPGAALFDSLGQRIISVGLTKKFK